MSVKDYLNKFLPEPVKEIIRPVYLSFKDKHSSELKYWEKRYQAEKGEFNNSFYEKIMLAMAEELSDDFLRGKIVADFGCGPRGSLIWAKSALIRIGIDVLVDVYADHFKSNVISHNMIYVKSTEKVIPMASESIDVLYSLNALDHVKDFPCMCNELLRILKPKGEIIIGFNVNEPPSPTEPQQLTENLIKKHLLSKFDIKSYRITSRGPKNDPYAHFYNNELNYDEYKPGFLWVRASKLY